MPSANPAQPAPHVWRVTGLLTRFPHLVLAFVCVALWLPGVLFLPPLDRDESRFAQASRQMLERGDFIDIRFGTEARYKKPAGIYWLQAATTEVAGLGHRDRIWTYRLASLLGGIAASWLTWSIARSMAPAGYALGAAALLSATLLLSAEATIATTDAVLLACVLAAQNALLRVYRTDRDGGPPVSTATVLSGWIGIGLGILVKGPIAPAIVAATAIALVLCDRSARWLRNVQVVRGISLVVLIVAPWALAIAIQSHGQFYAQAVGSDFASKLVGGQETHGAPPGYYLALATLTLWPATLFVLPGLRAAIAHRRETSERFLVVWAASAWLIFEAAPTKLTHYILPAYPALIILGSLASARSGAVRAAWRWASVAQYLAGLVLLVGAVALATIRYGSGRGSTLIAALVIVALLGGWTGVLFLRRREAAASATAVLAAVLLNSAITLLAAPRLESLWVSSRLATAIQQNSRDIATSPVLAGFDEPSLMFELGTRTRLTDGPGAAKALAQTGGIAGVEDHEREAFLRTLAEHGGEAKKLTDVDGLNYSHGRFVHVGVYRVMPAAPRR